MVTQPPSGVADLPWGQAPGVEESLATGSRKIAGLIRYFQLNQGRRLPALPIWEAHTCQPYLRRFKRH